MPSTVLAVAHGREYSYESLGAKVTKSAWPAWPLFFLELSKILENKGPL